jgi:DNA-binding winged helix-turn-helix (wHTH) protein
MANSKTAARESTPTDLRRSASVHFLTSSTRVGQRSIPSTQMLPISRNEPVAFLADIDGVPTLIRFLATDIPAEMQFNDGYFISKDTDIHSLLSNALEKVAETVLRVGSLELDLIGRTAKRGDRAIDLRPREFHLLKYMMQQSDQLLTRATLLKEVWHYKFVPETNLVDVHMGRLRRKVDGPDEVPMIRNVRGAGFVLRATPTHKVLLHEDATRI